MCFIKFRGSIISPAVTIPFVNSCSATMLASCLSFVMSLWSFFIIGCLQEKYKNIGG